jgi:hypothetical protein
MAPPPPELMEELVEQILLRLPPDVRAVFVRRLWRRIASATAFRRRFLEFHRTAPVLGVLCTREADSDDSNDDEDQLMTARFFPTSSFRPACAKHRGCHVVEARHGRVLLGRDPSGSGPWMINLIVWNWNPVTDEQQELPSLPLHGSWAAAMVCAASSGGRSGCDHLDYHRGSFLVVAVFAIKPKRMFTLIYASETNAWSEVASTNRRYHSLRNAPSCCVLLGNAIHFLASDTKNSGIVKYDMIKREISTMDLTSEFIRPNIVLMTMEDGRLGLATACDKLTSYGLRRTVIPTVLQDLFSAESLILRSCSLPIHSGTTLV